MKKFSFLLLLTILFNNAFTQTIHFLQLVNEADKNFSIVTQKGEEQMAKVFESMATIMKYGDVKYKTLTNEDFNSVALNNAIEELSIKPDDILVFYYSGIGTYPKTSQSAYPFFQLNDSSSVKVSFDEVCNKIIKKGARLNIALADCRNTRLKLETPTIPKRYGRNTDLAIDIRYQIVSNLLLTTNGLVKIASQEKGGNSNVILRKKLERESPTSPYVLKIDPNEYSVFSVAFADVFERLIKQKNTYYQFDDFTNRLQYRINLELNPTDLTKRTQTIVSEVINFDNPDLSKTNWVNLANDNVTFEYKLNQLLDIKENNNRKQFIENMIKKFENDNLELFVWSISDPELDINQNKVPLEYSSVAEYLQRFENYRPVINSVRIENRKILKTPFAQNKKLIMQEFYND